MRPLTKRQSDLFNFLKAESGKDCPPSFEEMRIALGLKSKSAIHRLVEALAERGFIRRIPNRARCIELVENPTIHVSRNLRHFTNQTLAEEARHRGLVLGTIVETIGVGGRRKTFQEVR